LKPRTPQKKTVIETLPIKMLTARLAPALFILLCVTLIAFHRLDTLPVERMRTFVTDATAPVMEAISKPFNDFAESFEGVTTIRTLKAENIRLKEENEKLHQWYESALRLEAENRSFRDLLNVRTDPAFNFVTTRIISDPGGSFVKSVLLAAGSNDKVEKGSAVLSGHGLVGRVVEAGARSARVLLVTDLNSRLPVVIQDTRTRAILAGKNTDLLELERLPIDSGVTVGQRVVTSGDNGYMPPNIPIGTIVEVSPGRVVVKPLADIEKSSYVQVINTGLDAGLFTGEIE
jgi:rod shape-determining protein MreC